MKTITVSNIMLAFDTDKNENHQKQALNFIDFLNEVMAKMGLPDNPQILLLEEDKVEVNVIPWKHT